MTESAKHITDEQTGISYTLSPEGYYLPDLVLPEEEYFEIAMLRRFTPSSKTTGTAGFPTCPPTRTSTGG